jgi:hypothetical protein
MNVTDVKERYAVSGVSSRPAPRRNRIHAEIGQDVHGLETGSPEEAEREGLRRLKGLYPERDGWEDYSVVVMVIETTEVSASQGVETRTSGQGEFMIASGSKIVADGDPSDPNNLSILPCTPQPLGSLLGLADAICAGARLHAFRSGGGLRVVRIERDGQLVAYGEHPYLEQALAYAEEDLAAGGCRYQEVYGKTRPHYLTGSSTPSSSLDRFVCRGPSFDVTCEGGEFVFCAEFSHERRTPQDVIDRVLNLGIAIVFARDGFVYQAERIRFANEERGVSTRVLVTPKVLPGEPKPDPWFERRTIKLARPGLKEVLQAADDVVSEVL